MVMQENRLDHCLRYMNPQKMQGCRLWHVKWLAFDRNRVIVFHITIIFIKKFLSRK